MKNPLAAIVAALAACLSFSGCAPSAPATENGAPRISSLAPNITEIIYAIGAESSLVGRTDACNYPPECASVPVIGNFGRAFPEALAATRTELLLSIEFDDPSTKDAIRRLGIRHECIPCRMLDDIAPAILRVGEFAGRAEEARALADGLSKEIGRLRAEAGAIPDDEKPLVFLEMWDSPMMTPGRDCFLSEVVALAGGRNLGDDLENKDYTTISPEWVVARDPDVIVCLYGGDDEAARKRVSSRVGWGGVKAVRDGRVYADFDIDAVCRPGPRVLTGVSEIARMIGH